MRKPEIHQAPSVLSNVTQQSSGAIFVPAFNAGSTSLKCALFNGGTPLVRFLSGIIDRIGWPDANCLLTVTAHCVRSPNNVNMIIDGKQPSPQCLNMDEAIKHTTADLGIWKCPANRVTSVETVLKKP